MRISNTAGPKQRPSYRLRNQLRTALLIGQFLRSRNAVSDWLMFQATPPSLLTGGRCIRCLALQNPNDRFLSPLPKVRACSPGGIWPSLGSHCIEQNQSVVFQTGHLLLTTTQEHLMLLSEITTFICGTGRIAQVVKCLPGKKKMFVLS
jgi:hypothetical protein